MSKNETAAQETATTTLTGKTTIRKIRTKAEEVLANGVTTRATLAEALPVLIALQERIAMLSGNLKVCRGVATSLSEACTAYVTERPSALEEGKFFTNQNGVMVGDVVVGDDTYHIAKGFSGYERCSGENVDQGFLARLPKAFVKTRLGLDTTAINAKNLTADALKEYDLQDKPNNVWSLTPVADSVE